MFNAIASGCIGVLPLKKGHPQTIPSKLTWDLATI